MRDTLAGIFEDRAVHKFAYTPIALALLFGSVCAMVLAVGARRMGVPDVLAGFAARRRERKEAHAKAKAEKLALEKMEEQLAREEQSRLADALLARKQKVPAGSAVAGEAVVIAASKTARQDAPEPRAPRMQLPLSPRAARKKSAAQPRALAGERELTAAERLALKRRERK